MIIPCNYVSKRPCRHGIGKVPLRRLIVACLSLAAASSLASNEECRPESKHVCLAERCDRDDGEFRHAESFTFDATTRKLTACLWSNCYTGKVTEHRLPGKNPTRTLVGVLRSDNPTTQLEPITVSLTIDADRHFMAAWGYSGRGVTLDFGRCSPRP